MNEKRDKQIKEKKRTLEDHNFALLTILSQNSSRESGCPGPEDLAAFSEGSLKKSRRMDIIAHLNECAVCRRHCFELRTSSAEPVVKKKALLQKILEKVRQVKFTFIFAGGGMGLALAASILIFVLVPHQNDLKQMISDSYTFLSPADVARFNSFTTKGEEINVDGPIAKAMMAYKTGVAQGKNRLLSEIGVLPPDDLKDQKYSALYSMGEWVVLLQCACLSKKSALDNFWAMQTTISTKLLNEIEKTANAYSKSENKQITSTITTIKKAINHNITTGSKIDGCNEIAFAVEAFENNLLH